MNYYLRKSPVEYELINKERFNFILKDILTYHIQNENKHLELSILIQKFKKSFNSEEIQLYINDNGKYKIRNINTYIKQIYGSFQKFLDHNNIKYQSMICIKS
jgi:hypothetical protein